MIDYIRILVKSGNGGNGCVSGRREKFVPAGGPDGGDVGDGGSVYFICDRQLTTLSSLRHKNKFIATLGKNGTGSRKSGKSGQDIEIKVPAGTEVWTDDPQPRLLTDITEHTGRVMVAEGGRGGRGNARFVTPTNRFPRLAEAGEQGEEIRIRLELKLIADVGIVGEPNVGKSSLLSVVTSAKPKIDNYPFTTLEPVLGVVEHKNTSFVLVDIPGLVEGAHRGVGLGKEFLRHVERTKILIHMIDGSSSDIAESYRQTRNELGLFDSNLLNKRCVVVVNKIDIEGVKDLIKSDPNIISDVEDQIYFVSVATGEGVGSMMDRVIAMIGETNNKESLSGTSNDIKVLRPKAIDREVVRRKGKQFEVVLEKAKRIAGLVDPEDYEARTQLYGHLKRLRVIEALDKAGVKEGDIVTIGKIKWKWE